MVAAFLSHQFEADLVGLPKSTFQHHDLMFNTCEAVGLQGNPDGETKAWSQDFSAEHDYFLEATSLRGNQSFFSPHFVFEKNPCSSCL